MEAQMFQTIFDMDQGVDVQKIEDILPLDWTVDATGFVRKTLTLMNDLQGEKVGHVQILSDEVPGKILISADEETSQGKQFWKDFGEMYKELDPFGLRFGVIYLSGENVAELDELSDDLPVGHHILQQFSLVKDAYYVCFFLGDWHCGESLQVQTIARIQEDGTTINAPDMPKQFALAK